MQCIAPINIAVSGQRYTVPCQKCNFCHQAKKKDWDFRLSWEMKRATTAYFITLTYKNESIPTVSDEKFTYTTLHRPDLIKFHKAVRNANAFQCRQLKKRYKLSAKGYRDLKEDYKIKYYSVGEYGGKRGRPHYHIILFNLHENVYQKLTDAEIWTKGHIYVGTVNSKSISYVTKYLIDKETLDNTPRERPFSIMSKGLGLNYLKNRRWHKAKGDKEEDYRFYVRHNGYTQRMPRYFKDKIFNEFERKRAGQKALEEIEKLRDEQLQKLYEEWGDEKTAIEKYYEQIQSKHDSIKYKSQLKNSL